VIEGRVVTQDTTADKAHTVIIAWNLSVLWGINNDIILITTIILITFSIKH